MSTLLRQSGCDAPPSVADEKIIGRCAWIAGRHASPGLTRDDMLQEGRIALLIARRKGQLPLDALHRSRYIARRVLGAMQDANSVAWRQQPLGLVELDDESRQSVDAPDRICEMRQALDRMQRCGSKQLVECMVLLAEGNDIKTVAGLLGVCDSRVSRLRDEARRLVARCW